MPSPTDLLPEYGPQPRPALQQTRNNNSSSSSSRSSQQQQLQQQRQSFALSGVPSSSSRWRNGSLVPSGFECVAHPVFFRTRLSNAGDGSGDGDGGGLMGRATTASSGATTIALHSSHDHEAGAGLAFILSAELADNSSNNNNSNNESNSMAGGGESKKTDEISSEEGSAIARATASGGEREVDVVCPICLDRYDQPVTLTSCLHTFCHTCILGWYEHTVAVALAKGGMSGLLGAYPSDTGINMANNNNTSSGNSNNIRAPPAPYRCPLCQIPGPYFLAVEPAPPALSKAAGKPKLKFRLLGARTVLGGGGPASGGVEVERADGGGSDGSSRRREAGYPSMVELREAVRTQLALAAAVSALEGSVAGGRGEKRKSGAEDSADEGGGRGGGEGDEGKGLARRLASTSGQKKLRPERRECGAKESGEHHRVVSRRSASGGGVADLQGPGNDRTDRRARKEEKRRRRRRKGGGEESERPEEDRRTKNRRRDRKRGGYGDDSRRTGHDCQLSDACGGSSSVEQRLPWEPGSLAAEDGLADVEAMLHREREKLQRKAAGDSVS